MHNLLKSEAGGDLLRGLVGMCASAMAITSTLHEEFDGWLRTASFLVGFFGSVAMLISLCQRIAENKKKSDGISFKTQKDGTDE